MVQQRPVPPVRQPMRSSEPPPSGPNKGGGWFWLVALVAVGAIVAVSQHTSTSTGAADGNEAMAADMGNAQQALVSAVAAQTPPAPLALSPAAVRRGTTRVALAGREGVAGEMIYSQNCYDALGRAFSWRKLDECGGFDVEGGLGLADEQAATPTTEAAWFEPETAAGRYLKAATAAGLEAGQADERLAGLQRQVGSRHKGPAAKPADLRSEDASDPTDRALPPPGNFG